MYVSDGSNSPQARSSGLNEGRTTYGCGTEGRVIVPTTQFSYVAGLGDLSYLPMISWGILFSTEEGIPCVRR